MNSSIRGDNNIHKWCSGLSCSSRCIVIQKLSTSRKCMTKVLCDSPPKKGLLLNRILIFMGFNFSKFDFFRSSYTISPFTKIIFLTLFPILKNHAYSVRFLWFSILIKVYAKCPTICRIVGDLIKNYTNYTVSQKNLVRGLGKNIII